MYIPLPPDVNTTSLDRFQSDDLLPSLTAPVNQASALFLVYRTRGTFNSTPHLLL